ncbi:MAG TPA: UDP-glucuronic acid decarboxylase family protein [Pyrinomonadaceae bacterium]|nr:UDP-glucuronic acid decarboxylase family protein [Pyrinomonadaceae bacterium]
MKILVTGGGGFLGSHLCEQLLAQGAQVICLDNFFTGRRENVLQLLEHPRFQLLDRDVIDPVHVDVEQIYNLACPASPVHYQCDPVKTVRTNVMGTINMLDLAHRTRARILQASTSEVYGDPTVHPQTEDYWGHVNPVGRRSCYDEGKRVAETLMMDYHRQYGVETRIARIFNTYGPRMLENDGRVVSNFIVQALRGEDLTVYGTGAQTRSFCYVDDLVEGLIRLMNAEQAPQGFDLSAPVNLGNPVECTMRELAEEVIRLCGREVRIKFCPLPPDDPKQRRPDISRAQTLLAWSPGVSLREGIAKTIADFEARWKQAATSAR